MADSPGRVGNADVFRDYFTECSDPIERAISWLGVTFTSGADLLAALDAAYYLVVGGGQFPEDDETLATWARARAAVRDVNILLPVPGEDLDVVALRRACDRLEPVHEGIVKRQNYPALALIEAVLWALELALDAEGGN